MATASVTPLSSSTFSTSKPTSPIPKPHPSSSTITFKTDEQEYLNTRKNQQRSVLPNDYNAIFSSNRSTRREFVRGMGLLPLLAVTVAPPPPHSEAREVEVGGFLPPSPSDPSFVLFKASPKDTPALRAGNVQPYQFILPPTWKQTRIANILSGNYCQPKCAEPWVEVKFEDEKQGQVQVVASPLIRLTNKPNATIEDIGTPEKVIASLGPFVTGSTYDHEELIEMSVEKRGDQMYYNYALETPYALTGSHNLAKATAKGNTGILFLASTNDKQWQSSQKTLKAILDSIQI